jgi:hypothetical protein
MSWAERRRFFILLGIGLVIAAFIAIILIASFYKTPTCTDGIQNQSEQGIDCGGPCPYLCTALEQPPTVLFTKVLQNANAEGRTDVIALVENKNANAAAKNVPYQISLYGADQTLIQEVSGTIDLPPGATEPVFVPGIFSGEQKVGSAFLTIATSSPQWFFMAANARITPMVSNIIRSGTASNPRVEATLTNPSAAAMTNVQATILVYDANKNVIAASQTVVPIIAGQSQAVATFTWNSAFLGTPALLEVVPIIPLP